MGQLASHSANSLLLEDLGTQTFANTQFSNIDMLALKACMALQNLHGLLYVHTNLKPTNLLVQCIDNELIVKLGGFGSAQLIKDVYCYRGFNPEFTAPEIIEEKKTPSHNLMMYPSCDIYSLGVIFEKLYGNQEINIIKQMKNPTALLRPTIETVMIAFQDRINNSIRMTLISSTPIIPTVLRSIVFDYLKL
jgi:serine/threonine protein kinase